MRRIIFIIFFFFSFFASAQKQVTVVVDGLFPFDPITSRYVVRSLAPISTYAEAWRAEGQKVEIFVIDSLSFGYRYYCEHADTTLKNRVLSYVGATLQTDTSVRVSDISGFSYSADFLAVFDPDIERIKRFYATPIAVFDTAKVYDPYAPCDFMALFHTFQIEVSGADLSIVAPPRRDVSLNKECYIKQLASLLRYDNDLVVVRLSGRQVKDLMEDSYQRRYYQIKDDGSDLLRIFTPAYLYSSIAPVAHTVNLTKPAGRRVENWPLDEDTIYKVALNSFLARDIEGVEVVGEYKMLLINWLRETKNPFRIREDYQLQPARVVARIVEREGKTIFGK